MIRRDVVLAVEGKLTTDGRLIQRGALTWNDDVSIFEAPGNHRVGHIESIHRDGDQIRARAIFYDGFTIEGKALQIECNHVETELTIDGVVAFTNARLRGAILGTAPVWDEVKL